MLTVVAYWFDEGVPFVEPLLHRIAVDLNGRSVKVVFVGDGLAAYRAAVLTQFAKYTPCFSWACCAPSRPYQTEVKLGSLVPDGDVLVLPASAVPVGDALKTLGGSFAGLCVAPGAWAAYSADAMRSNLTPAMVADCLAAGAAPVRLTSRADFDAASESGAVRPFVAYPPPRNCFRPLLSLDVAVFGESA